MATLYSARTRASTAYRCASCGLRGTGTAEGVSATSKPTQQEALESAVDAARDAVKIAACPKCGKRDATEVARVRSEATSHGGLAALASFVITVSVGWLRAPTHLVGFAIGGAVVGVVVFALVMIFRYGGRMRASDAATIVPDERA